MQFTTTITALLLAASSALAAPANVQRASSVQITDLWARNAPFTGAYMHFVLTDPNYPDDTPTDCNLMWTYGGSPDARARCNNSQYYIRFPSGPIDFDLFTLELERVSGPFPEKGQVMLNSNANGQAPATKWVCKQNPEPNVDVHCGYEGVLEMQV